MMKAHVPAMEHGLFCHAGVRVCRPESRSFGQLAGAFAFAGVTRLCLCEAGRGIVRRWNDPPAAVLLSAILQREGHGQFFLSLSCMERLTAFSLSFRRRQTRPAGRSEKACWRNPRTEWCSRRFRQFPVRAARWWRRDSPPHRKRGCRHSR